MEMDTNVEESGEASRRDARRDGRRVAMDVEKRLRLRRGVPSSEQGRRRSEGNSVNSSKFQFPVCKFNFSPCSWPQMKNF